MVSRGGHATNVDPSPGPMRKSSMGPKTRELQKDEEPRARTWGSCYQR